MKDEIEQCWGKWNNYKNNETLERENVTMKETWNNVEGMEQLYEEWNNCEGGWNLAREDRTTERKTKK